MKRPSSRTIAAAAGAVTLSGIAVAAVAASDDSDPSAVTQPATTEEAPAAGDDPSVKPTDTPSASPSSTPSATGSPEPLPSPSADPTSNPGNGSAQTGEITSGQAVAIAEQALAGVAGVPSLREVELEFEHGRNVWEVEFGDSHEVYVDVATGEIVEIEIDDEDDDRSGHGGGDRDDDYDDDRYDD